MNATWDTTPVERRHHDFTGDGVDEVLAVFQCPASTSGWPNTVVVFDVSGNSPKARVIGVLGHDADIRQGPTRVSGKTVTMSGPSVVVDGSTVADESNANPRHHATLVYRWTGSRFTLAHKTETLDGAVTADTVDGTVRAYLTDVGDASVTYDQVQYFEGAAATAACREDGVPDDGTEWCNDYYVRNTSAKKRTVSVSPSATVSYVDRSGEPQQVTGRSLSRLVAAGRVNTATGERGPVFTLVVRGGSAVSLEEVFTP